jgi:hypothetical protein
MLRKPSSKLPARIAKRTRAPHALPTHRSNHILPDQLLPWLLAAALLFGLAMLTLALTARADALPAEPRAGLPSGHAVRAVIAGVVPADADDFARNFFQHEVQAESQDHALWSYRATKREGGELKTMQVYQTRQGEIDRLVSVDGHLLNANELAAEDQRIQGVISDPALMRKRQKKQHDDSEQARELLKIFPEAFRFQYEGKEGSLVRLRFSPNPKFDPPDHATQVFHHMEGTVLVNAQQQRLAAINGELTSEVKFFGGLFGYLAKGGTFNVVQKEVSPKVWEVTRMHVHMDGKALLFKTIAVQEDENYSDFRAVPESTTLSQAAELLKRGGDGDSESAQAQNRN